ncbi:aminotransferase class I/II-fold pyridoxal phosphate-dependent enzyme [Microbacterium mangrovi]|nr:aminotransferase class I/II-fold pyridoxal phosphate-dependent enzyme [Microbacterium mangrovi]
MTLAITGRTASEIADSVRGLVERGVLSPGEPLPPVRALAAKLGVNRNTAVAAYRHLAATGLVESRGRAGTVVSRPRTVAMEGFARDTVLRDVGSGNPDAHQIPSPARALQTIASRPVLYGEPVIDPALEAWAAPWLRADLAPGEMRLTITSGAADATERLLAQSLQRDDVVALEDPCFLASIHTVRIGGYRPVAVPVDEEGMTVDGLRAAIAEGARAIVYTPRAQNPTGASLTGGRAAALRDVLRDHPYLLVIEDDHFSLLSQQPYHSVIGPDHRRFAVVRSVSKFLGPDMGVAAVASDPDTAERLALRLTPGTTWVSHLLQRLAAAQLTDPEAQAQIAAAGRHYAARNARFAELLTAHGVPTTPGDGLSMWVGLPVPAREACEQLMRRGWLARPGDEFMLDAAGPSVHVRFTVHELDDPSLSRLAADVAAAVAAVQARDATRTGPVR